jgi:hypothetical protein
LFVVVFVVVELVGVEPCVLVVLLADDSCGFISVTTKSHHVVGVSTLFSSAVSAPVSLFHETVSFLPDCKIASISAFNSCSHCKSS